MLNCTNNDRDSVFDSHDEKFSNLRKVKEHSVNTVVFIKLSENTI